MHFPNQIYISIKQDHNNWLVLNILFTVLNYRRECWGQRPNRRGRIRRPRGSSTDKQWRRIRKRGREDQNAGHRNSLHRERSFKICSGKTKVWRKWSSAGRKKTKNWIVNLKQKHFHLVAARDFKCVLFEPSIVFTLKTQQHSVIARWERVSQ